MRTRRLLVLAPYLFLACSSSSGTPGGSDASDASDEQVAADDGGSDGSLSEAGPTDGGHDATTTDSSTPMDSGSGRDASDGSSPTDAARDAPTEAALDAAPDAPPSVIEVIVAGFSAPESGVPVVFGDSTGAVVSTVMTDSQGIATTTDPSVTMATVVMGAAAEPYMYTAMGLKLGDVVPVADPSPGAVVPTTPAVNVGVDSDASVPNFAAGACSSQVTDGIPLVWSPLNLWTKSAPQPVAPQPCIGAQLQGSTTVPVIAGLATTGDGTGFLSATVGLAPLDDAGNSNLLFSGAVQPSTTQTVALASVDGGGAGTTGADQVTYSEVAAGLLTPQWGTSGTYPATFEGHTGFASGVQVEALRSWQQPSGALSGVVMAGAAPSSDSTVTIDESLFTSRPLITGASSDLSNIARPVVSWTVASGDLGGAAAIVVHVANQYLTDAGTPQKLSWTVVSPGMTGSSFPLPALPAALAGYAPQSNSGPSIDVTALYGSGTLTYSAVRKVGSLFPQQSCFGPAVTPMVPPLPGGTTVVVMFSTSC